MKDQQLNQEKVSGRGVVDESFSMFQLCQGIRSVYYPFCLFFTNTLSLPILELPAFLLYIVGHEIRKCTLDGQSETRLVHWEGKNGSPPLFVDFHYKENRIYWPDNNSIHRSFFDGSGK